MSKLSFHARGDLLVYDPTRTRMTGQLAPYVGRVFDAESRSYPAIREPYTVPLSGIERMRVHARRGAVWCADRDTAALMGVQFVDVEWVDGEWVESKQKPAAKSSASRKGDD